MKWVEALKEQAKMTGKYVVPKKGTAEYEAVRQIMTEQPVFDNSKLKKTPLPKEMIEEVKEKRLFNLEDMKGRAKSRARGARASKTTEEVGHKGGVFEKKEKRPIFDMSTVKPRRRVAKEKSAPKAKKVVKEVVEVAKAVEEEEQKPHIFDLSMATRKARKAPKKAQSNMIAKSEGVTKIDTARSQNPEVLMNIATNVHEPVAPPAALGGDVKALKKAVARVRKPKALPKLVEPEHVKNDAPFSILEMKRKLGA